jgi:hypothetical protein
MMDADKVEEVRYQLEIAVVAGTSSDSLVFFAHTTSFKDPGTLNSRGDGTISIPHGLDQRLDSIRIYKAGLGVRR